MKATRGLLFGTLSVLWACDLVTDPETRSSGDPFSARVEAEHLVLTNHSSEPVHYVALEKEESALVDLTHPRRWPSLAPAGQKRIAYRDVMGYKPTAKQAVVYWWTEKQDYVHVIVVDLQWPAIRKMVGSIWGVGRLGRQRIPTTPGNEP